ncbi:mucin-2 [Musca vetustissima]|uniref:mucin-2 n=1 Tax=Musca vetustissima TaxID=27455 RepID=UPI002AB7C6A5|nr:mucin-2 [Musca vetustissima]
MAATLQHCATATTTPSPLKSVATTSPNPQLKRLVYSKYRELLGSYNDQANAYIDTLPSYMVQKDKGFNLEPNKTTSTITTNGTTTTIHLAAAASPSSSISSSTSSSGGDHEILSPSRYGSGQRMPAQSNYEAPACVQNAMNRDKKPFTYTPGGIDLSQIKSERMAKRLARNACAEGAAGQSQQNRPGGAVQQPISPSSPGSAAAVIGAAGMGMPFQVLPPTPQPGAGKNLNGGCGPAPPPPPPPTSFSNTNNTTASLAPQMNGQNGAARGSSPSSPNMQRKIPPAPPSQRFEPPPLGFRPEIKIPPNPMAALRKVPPPVEKNTFWKDEYLKNKGSDVPAAASSNNNNGNNYNNNNSNSMNSHTEDNDSVNSSSSTSSSPQQTNGFRKTMPTTTTTNKLQQSANQQTNNNNNFSTNTQDQQQQQEAIKTPTIPQKPSQETEKSPQTSSPDTQSIHSTISNRPTPPTSPHQKLSSPSVIKQIERETAATPPSVASPPKSATPIQIQTEVQQQQRQPSPKPEFRSAASPPQPAAVNVFNRQTDSPRSVENVTPPRVTESPFRLAQQQQQARGPVAISPLAQPQQTPSPLSAGPSPSSQPQAQTVPWRTQRGQTPQQQGPTPTTANTQSHPQPFYNNVQAQQQQRAPDFSTQTSAYQGPKPTNVGSLYIAPLAAPVEPQAQHIVRQQLQQQQQQQPQRDSPMRQMGATQPPQQQLRWMSSQPKQTEQAPWARPEENGNVMPSSLNRIKSPPPATTSYQQQQQMQPQPSYQQPPSSLYQTQPSQPYNQGNGYVGQQQPATQNFGAVHHAPAGLRLQINTKAIQNNNNTTSTAVNQSGPRERIIPIQLEQTPTYTPPQPNFNTTPAGYSAGTGTPGYVMRTPNQFVDQGYNNFGVQKTPAQRVMSPPMQQPQLNAPRMVQQQQQQTGNARTHIVPIAMEGSDGTRGPISKAPIVIQNDLRTPPVQSKSFRILQKITDTIDDGTNDESGQQQQRNDNYMDAEPQLQRPTFARQMSAQQARNSPTVEQMRRMKIGQEQGNTTPQTPSQFNQQPRPFYNTNNDYIPPSEQHVPEPKKYTGSAIPSRSFKILQAMTQPENAECNDSNGEVHEDLNDESTQSDFHIESCNTSSAEPINSTSLSSLGSVDSISSGPTPPPTQAPLGYAPYPYPYGYPWYPPPPACDSAGNPIWPFVHAMSPSPGPSSQSGSESGGNTNPNWYYPYAMPPPPPPATPTPNGESQQNQHPGYPPYPYYYPYYPMPPPPPPFPQTPSSSTEFEGQNVYAPYLPPPPPYHSYPYPVAPSYSQSSACSSRASSVLPDIIITPSTDDVPSKVIMQHHIKIEKEKPPKHSDSLDIEDVTSEKSLPNKQAEGSIVDILTKHLQNMSPHQHGMENNLNSMQNAKKSYEKYFEQKSPEDNTSPVHISMVEEEYEEEDTDSESSESSVDSDATTKQYDTRMCKEGSVPLQAIRSVANIQVYNNLKNPQLDLQQDSEDSEDDDDDATTADGESDVFDEDIEEIEFVYEHQDEEQVEEEIEEEVELEDHEAESECEEFIVEDNLSVIYEEESDYEKSSDYGNKPCQNLKEMEPCIEEDSQESEGEEKAASPEEETNSVTVRLPLKFSFAKLTQDETPITTVVVGNSSVEEPSKSQISNEKPPAFSVATVETDSDAEDDEDDDSCDVSVTISLPRSSRSGSMDSEHRNTSAKYPIEEMPLPEEALPKIESSEEDVSFSLSLNKRNKFVGETLEGGVTNNIAKIEENREESKKAEEEEKKVEDDRKIDLMKSTSNFDFFATLMATKMQAQKIAEQSANYWGKPSSQNSNDEVKSTGDNSQKERSNGSDAQQNIATEDNKAKSDLKSSPLTPNMDNSVVPESKTEHKNRTLQNIATEINKIKNDLESQDSLPSMSTSEQEVSKNSTEEELTNSTTESKSKKVTKTSEKKKVKKPKSPEGKDGEAKPKKKVKSGLKSQKSKDKIPPTDNSQEVKVETPKEPEIKDDLKARTSFWLTEAKEAKDEVQQNIINSNLSQEASKEAEKERSETLNVPQIKAQNTSSESNILKSDLKPQNSLQNTITSQPSSEVSNNSQTEKIQAVKVPEFKDDLKARTSFWSKYSTNNKTSTTKTEVTLETANKFSTSLKEETETSSSTWDSNSSKNDSQTTQEETETTEIDDIWADRDDDLVIRRKPKLMYWDKYSKSSSGYETESQMDILESPTATQDDDIEDIWADRNDDDLPAVKNLSKKLDSLQTAKDSFWSSVAEANKVSEPRDKESTDFWSQLSVPKKKPRPETINEILYSPIVLRHRIDELAKALRATMHTQEPEPIETEEATLKKEAPHEKEEEEIDFWAQIEQTRRKSIEATASLSNNESEDKIKEEPKEQTFDPLKYPEEPREVDTDEEIDFWAEIEANRLPDGVEVTFERAASFWASRDRRNSSEETPAKPVLPKAFAAKLPDEPAKDEIDIWATLEAHKGEEPEIVDPQIEEEKKLAEEFQEIAQDPEEDINNSVMDLASVHEPVKASVWAPKTTQQQEEVATIKSEADEEPDFWAEIEKSRSTSMDKEADDKLETKRKNFRNAKAFFTNSVDEPKEENKAPLENQTEKPTKAKKETEKKEEDEEGSEEGKKVKKPPKKEVKAKSKSKSPKGKSKELKADKSPSTDLPEVYVEPTLKRLSNGLPDLEVTKFYEERKVSVRDRISVFETSSSTEAAPDSRRNSINNQKLSVDINSSAMRRSSLSRNSSSQRSESEMEEDDSGVTDMNKLSETETESGSFPELRKMSSYQRAATHSRLFKLLQDDPDTLEDNNGENKVVDEFQFRPSRRKVVHNVSITRKQNPKALGEAESMSQRRERLSLPLRKNTSIDADNPSTPNSPASPIMDQPSSQCVVSDQLVSELVQSLLLKSDSTHLRKLPMEKLQAAAKRVLEEELDSLENTSVDSTPAMTPNDTKNNKSYADYYNTWSNANRPSEVADPRSLRTLQDNRRSPWTVRCPRVLSSKTINRDLARVTESPEIYMRSSKSPECFRQSRETSVSRWKKA